MKAESHHFIVHNVAAPIVEIDTEFDAVYVRFKRAKVVRTVAQPSKTMHVALDLDAKGEVIGIEAVGADEFSIQTMLKLAKVEVPRLDLSKVHYRSVSKANETLAKAA